MIDAQAESVEVDGPLVAELRRPDAVAIEQALASFRQPGLDPQQASHGRAEFERRHASTLRRTVEPAVDLVRIESRQARRARTFPRVGHPVVLDDGDRVGVGVVTCGHRRGDRDALPGVRVPVEVAALELVESVRRDLLAHPLGLFATMDAHDVERCRRRAAPAQIEGHRLVHDVVRRDGRRHRLQRRDIGRDHQRLSVAGLREVGQVPALRIARRVEPQGASAKTHARDRVVEGRRRRQVGGDRRAPIGVDHRRARIDAQRSQQRHQQQRLFLAVAIPTAEYPIRIARRMRVGAHLHAQVAHLTLHQPERRDDARFGARVGGREAVALGLEGGAEVRRHAVQRKRPSDDGTPVGKVRVGDRSDVVPRVRRALLLERCWHAAPIPEEIAQAVGAGLHGRRRAVLRAHGNRGGRIRQQALTVVVDGHPRLQIEFAEPVAGEDRIATGERVGDLHHIAGADVPQQEADRQSTVVDTGREFRLALQDARVQCRQLGQQLAAAPHAHFVQRQCLVARIEADVDVRRIVHAVGVQRLHDRMTKGSEARVIDAGLRVHQDPAHVAAGRSGWRVGRHRIVHRRDPGGCRLDRVDRLVRRSRRTPGRHRRRQQRAKAPPSRSRHRAPLADRCLRGHGSFVKNAF